MTRRKLPLPDFVRWLRCRVGLHGARVYGRCVACGDLARDGDGYDEAGDWRWR